MLIIKYLPVSSCLLPPDHLHPCPEEEEVVVVSLALIQLLRSLCSPHPPHPHPSTIPNPNPSQPFNSKLLLPTLFHHHYSPLPLPLLTTTTTTATAIHLHHPLKPFYISFRHRYLIFYRLDRVRLPIHYTIPLPPPDHTVPSIKSINQSINQSQRISPSPALPALQPNEIYTPPLSPLLLILPPSFSSYRKQYPAANVTITITRGGANHIHKLLSAFLGHLSSGVLAQVASRTTRNPKGCKGVRVYSPVSSQVSTTSSSSLYLITFRLGNQQNHHKGRVNRCTCTRYTWIILWSTSLPPWQHDWPTTNPQPGSSSSIIIIYSI